METMFMQNFGGKTKSIMVFFKVAYLTGKAFSGVGNLTFVWVGWGGEN